MPDYTIQADRSALVSLQFPNTNFSSGTKENLQDKAMSNEYLNQLHDRDNYEEVKSALNIGEYNMIVTPKEIDDLVDTMKDIVAKGINIAIS